MNDAATMASRAFGVMIMLLFLVMIYLKMRNQTFNEAWEQIRNAGAVRKK